MYQYILCLSKLPRAGADILSGGVQCFKTSENTKLTSCGACAPRKWRAETWRATFSLVSLLIFTETAPLLLQLLSSVSLRGPNKSESMFPKGGPRGELPHMERDPQRKRTLQLLPGHPRARSRAHTLPATPHVRRSMTFFEKERLILGVTFDEDWLGLLRSEWLLTRLTFN